MPPDLKPGYQSTEFYVTLIVLGLSAAFGLAPDAPWQLRLGAFLGAVASGLGYKWARTAQKSNAADVALNKDDPPAPLRGHASLAAMLSLALAGTVFCAALSVGCLSAAKKDRLKADLIACGINVGIAEWNTIGAQAKVILADASISDQEAQSALADLAATAKQGLLDCAVALFVDLTKPDPPAAPPATTVARSLSVDSTADRMQRRAQAWLGR